MYKITSTILTITFLAILSTANAQTGSFSTAAINKTWVVSKYFASFTQEDKKELFSNFTFKFINSDKTTFLAIDHSESIPDTCKGWWDEQNNKVSLSLTLEPDDKANYRVALLLNKAEMQETEITPSKLSFRIPDVMGYIEVEFTEK